MTEQELIAKFYEDIKEQHEPTKRLWGPELLADYIDTTQPPRHSALDRFFREFYMGTFVTEHMEDTVTDRVSASRVTYPSPIRSGELMDD